MKGKQTVTVRVWAGVGEIVAGGVLLFWRKQSWALRQSRLTPRAVVSPV